MKTCTQCILPETFPGIKFDDKGVCNHCLSFKGLTILEEQKRNMKKSSLRLLSNTAITAHTTV